MSLRRTLIISAFPACGKTHTYQNFNGKPYTMLDSDSSKYSWIYENGLKTNKRNPNFINDYISHIKENIGKVDVIFVSSHKAVREALQINNLKYVLVYPSFKMKNVMLNRMRQRGNDNEFIQFQDKHYEEFIEDALSDNCPILKFPLNKKHPYINNNLLKILFNVTPYMLNELYLDDNNPNLVSKEQVKLMLSELLEIAEKENFTAYDTISHALVWLENL